MSVIFSSLLDDSTNATRLPTNPTKPSSPLSSLNPPGLIQHNVMYWNGSVYLLNGKVRKNAAMAGNGAKPTTANASPIQFLMDSSTLEDKMYKLALSDASSRSSSSQRWHLAGTENLKHPKARFGSSVVLRKDSFVMFGGVDSKGALLNDLWEFNCKSETSSQLLSSKSFLHTHSTTQQWNEITPSSGIIGPRAFHEAVYVASQDSLYILFGKLKNGLSNDLYRFSFKTEAWELLNVHGKVPSERHLTAVTLSNDERYIYIYGGRSTKGKHDDFCRLKLDSLTWEEINTSLASAAVSDAHVVASPPKMQSHVMFFDRGHILVHGGSHASNVIYDYSIQDSVWRKIPVRGHALYGREYHSLVQTDSPGRFIMYGGYREDITLPKDKRVQIFNRVECVQSFHFKHQDTQSKHTNLNSMRKGGQLIDLKFQVGDKSFHCHQLLFQRSPQLAQLIEKAAQEQDSARVLTVKLSDVNPLVFHDFITWIYENKLTQIHSIIDLCKLAQEYEIFDLVLYCARQFQERINFKNIIHLFIEVENKKENTLRLLCQTYIHDHYTKILADANNVQMLSQVPNLLQEVMLLSRDKRPQEVSTRFPQLQNIPLDSFKMFDMYLHKLWQEKRGMSGDLKLVGKDSSSFNVHRVLLAAQSPIFLDEFTANDRTVMKINADGKILEKLIEFVYRGSIQGGSGNSSELSIDLLKDIALVAHKWIPCVEDWAIELLLDRVRKSTATRLLSVCKSLKSLENIEVLKQVCKLEIAEQFTVQELAEMLATLLADG